MIGDAIPGHRGFSVIRAHGTSHAHPVLRFGSVSNGRSFLNVHDAMITKLLDLIRQGRLRRRAAPPLRGGRKPTARRGASLMREKHERHPDDRPVFARQTFALPVVFLPGATTHANISPSRSAERAIEAGTGRVEATSREHETEHDAAYPGYVVLVVSFSFVSAISSIFLVGDSPFRAARALVCRVAPRISRSIPPRCAY